MSSASPNKLFPSPHSILSLSHHRKMPLSFSAQPFDYTQPHQPEVNTMEWFILSPSSPLSMISPSFPLWPTQMRQQKYEICRQAGYLSQNLTISLSPHQMTPDSKILLSTIESCWSELLQLNREEKKVRDNPVTMINHFLPNQVLNSP